MVKVAFNRVSVIINIPFPAPYHTSGHASDNSVGFHIFRYDGTRSHNRTLANLHSGQDDSAAAHPRERTYLNRPPLPQKAISL